MSKPYRSWEDDHTALVHVLWAEGIKGQDADDLASAIRQSRWYGAVRHRASGGAMLCENGQPDGHGHSVGANGSRCLAAQNASLTGGLDANPPSAVPASAPSPTSPNRRLDQ